MFGGLLAFLGIYGASALNALADDVSMMKHSRTVDKDGNVHYIDRLCNEYINNERVKKVETKDKNGVKLYSTVGVKSGRVYKTSYDGRTQRMFDISEQNKQMEIERGNLAYLQYNPYFGRHVTTEIATGKVITCLYEGKDPETGKSVYKKWYFRPECQDKYDWSHTVKGDYGIDITEEEYEKLKIIGDTSNHLPSDGKVLNKLWGVECFH